MGLTRRDLLRGAGASVLVLGTPVAGRVLAEVQAAPSDPSAPQIKGDGGRRPRIRAIPNM